MSAPSSAFDPARLKVLPREFFNRDPRRVCRDLLGKVLVRRESTKLLAGRVVELEAYMGAGDPAAHAYTGPTARNRVLFGPPGHAYIYFIYGNHYCLNVSCMPEGKAGSVLFRALEPLAGIAEMERARGLAEAEAKKNVLRLLTSGPGRLAEAFGITRPRDNGKDLTDATSDLFLADGGYPPPRVLTTARVGITKAAERPLRYVIAGSEFVSGTRALNRTKR
ncbi:MAG TPA: DNA-3-methyladenine glycosylase [Terriglobales bacterium]|nr:DNA-3-methyladenine glycosylase [Terriglobales bacterium]